MPIELNNQAWVSLAEWIELYNYLNYGPVFHFEQGTDPALDPNNEVRAGMWWADTTNLTINRRSADNTAWIVYTGTGQGGTLPLFVVDNEGETVVDNFGNVVTL